MRWHTFHGGHKEIEFLFYIRGFEVLIDVRLLTWDFQINGINLAEVEGGEVAVTNLHSCNGPDFVLNLHLYIEEEKAASKSPSEIRTLSDMYFKNFTSGIVLLTMEISHSPQSSFCLGSRVSSLSGDPHCTCRSFTSFLLLSNFDLLTVLSDVKPVREGNARLKCVYFPITEVQEFY